MVKKRKVFLWGKYELRAVIKYELIIIYFFWGGGPKQGIFEVFPLTMTYS